MLFLFPLLILRTKLLDTRDRGTLISGRKENCPCCLPTKSDSGKINLEWH